MTKKRERKKLLTGELPCAFQDVDADRLERPLQVALDGAREVLGVVGDRLALEADRSQLDPERGEVRRVLHLAHAARGREQGLGGDAAAVDAGAANVMAFDDGDLEAACEWI
jgi:hypothetical protein